MCFFWKFIYLFVYHYLFLTSIEVSNIFMSLYGNHMIDFIRACSVVMFNVKFILFNGLSRLQCYGGKEL